MSSPCNVTARSGVDDRSAARPAKPRERCAAAATNGSLDPARIALVTGRVPMLPARVAREILVAPDPLQATRELLEASPLFDAAVFLASKSLHEALGPWRGGEEPKKKRAPLKALSYALRMSTRSTPFGLFAGTGVVARGSSCTLSLGAQPALFAASDTAWLSDYQARLERDPDVRGKLLVVANDLLIVRGDRAYVHHPERLRRGLDPVDAAILHYEPVTVRWTETLAAVMALAAAELPLCELQAAMTARLGMRPGVASGLTERLLEIGCLVFSRPVGVDALRVLGSSLAETNAPAAAGIAGLARTFARLEAQPATAVTRACLTESGRAAAALHHSAASPLQVNVIASFAGTLGERVLADVAHLGTLLIANARPRKLTDYRAKFLERYEGDSRRVPLLELTDPDVGIGAPHDPMDAPEEPEPARDRLRLQLIARALRDRTPEIAVDAKQLLALHNVRERAAAPQNGFEIGFQIAARDLRAIDAGDYSIRPVYGINTDGPYKTVHRFEHKLATGIAASQRTEAEPGIGVLPAELVFTPYDAHYANLLQVPANGYVIASRRERLPAHLTRIEPRDVVIGLEGARFVAYSLSLQRRLLVRESYMLQVPYFAPPHFRLLSMIGKQDHVMPQLLGWGNSGAMPFTPRVRHGRLVVAVARWTLSRQDLESRRQDLPRYIGEWRREWNVPRYVYLVERDLKLLLDLDSSVATALIYDQLGTPGDGYPVGAFIAFEEMFPAFDQLWLSKDGEPYFHEFVAGFAAKEPPLTEPAPAPAFGARADVKHGPGSAWTFAKMYCPAAEMDIVLRSVAPLVSSASRDVERWFFLRYADPQPHIRLRLRSETNAAGILAAVTSQLGELLAQGTIARYALDTYEPESERYGGAEAMGLAEILFDGDSRRVIDLLLERGPLPWEARLVESFRYIAAFLGEWFRAFGRERWLRANEPLARAVRGVKWPQVRTLRDMIGAQPVMPEAACAAIAGLANLERSGRLEVASVELCMSLLHMHFNRIGIPMQAERNIVAAIWHAWDGIEKEARATGQPATVVRSFARRT